nr:conserved hypothetical protein [Melanopsichium pennsylvanicum 4]
MATDARLLLRQATKSRASSSSIISDPFASYSSTGALRCSACNFVTIKHESLWSSHALSKSHRANTARLREEDLRQAEAQRIKDGKRKADDSQDDLGASHGPSGTITSSNGEEKGNLEFASQGSKKARTESIDPEWELFKSQMEANAEPKEDQQVSDHGAGAALEAEAYLISPRGTAANKYADDLVDERSKEELEAEERARREQEEREEILSRLEEEQRQQDEADQR